VRLEATAANGGSAAAAEINVQAAAGTIVPHSQTRVTATSEQSGYSAQNLVDDDPASLWQSATGLPQSITLSLGQPLTIDQLTYLPRQDSSTGGTITAYNVYASTDGQNFMQVASGTWPDDQTAKVAIFKPVQASYIKLEATATDGGSYATASEVNVAAS